MKVPKFTSWLKPILVLSIVCSFTFTAGAQNYYPAEVGNMWTLNSTDGTQQRRYMIEDAEDFNGLDVRRLKIDEETLGTSAIIPDRYLITVDDNGLTLHRSDTDEGTFGIATVIYDPPTFFFPSSPTLGQTWQIMGETELLIVGAASNITTDEVVAFEDVVTPAGTFENCAKIHLTYKITTALVTLRPEEYIWLAPDVGPVRFQNSNDVVFELESYALVEPTAEEMPPTEETTEAGTEIEVPAEPTVVEPNADGGMDIAPNYYPTEIGNTWILQSTDGTEQLTYTLEGPTDIDGEELIKLKISTETLGTSAVDIDNYFVSVRDGGLLLHQSVTDEGAFGIAEATFDPPVTFFPALLPIGHTWEIMTET